MASTITLQQTLNYASTHADLLPLANVGGYANEPGLTICNDALSDIITDPNDWVFNRTEMAMLFTCWNKQDYLFAGAVIFAIAVNPTSGDTQAYPTQGWAIDLASNSAITVSGGVVTVKTIEQHRFVVGQQVYMTGVVAQSGNDADASAYNSLFTDDGFVSQWNPPTGVSSTWTVTAVTSYSVSFDATNGQSNGDVLGAPGITNFGWATSATLQELNNNSSPPNQRPCTVRRELPIVSICANPEKVAVIADLGTGVLKIRFHVVPSTVIWGCNIVYQAQAPLKTSLSQTWSPIPDTYRAVINQAVIYRAYRYLGDNRADSEYKKLQAEILKTQSADEGTSTDTTLQPQENFMGFEGFEGWW